MPSAQRNFRPRKMYSSIDEKNANNYGNESDGFGLFQNKYPKLKNVLKTNMIKIENEGVNRIYQPLQTKQVKLSRRNSRMNSRCSASRVIIIQKQ